MIKIIKYHICYNISEEDKKTKSWEYIDISNDEFHEFRNALIQLLDLYNQEKEKNKKLEEVKCFRDSYEEARIEECDNYFMLNRIINLMAEDLKKNVDVLFDTNKSIIDIKAYYFNKAKEIKNE